MPTADIVIVGGGIIGASIAYQLTMRGARNVVLLERATIASGTSGRATGGIRQQFADELDIRFSIAGVRFYEQFTRKRDRHPQRPRFYQYGYLFLVTTPASWQAMLRFVALQQSLGVPTQLLTPADVHQRLPQLVLDDVLGATFCPTDGYSDPGAMAQALLQEAQTRGLVVHEHTPVTGITIASGRVQAVQTPRETIQTPLIVNATGPFSAFVARLAGIADFPVYPLRRQLYLTEPFSGLPDDVPMVVDLSTGFHFRRREKRIILTMPLPVSAEEEERNRNLEPDAFALPVNEDFWPEVRAEIQRRCPPLLKAGIERVWSGLYEMTPDEHPILGKTEIEGFLCACGFSGHGFMHAPMAAKLLTELILDGKSTTLPIEPFSHQRFRTGKLFETTRLL
ncbi:MAG TPA: FAD-binding oxidoreductase [Ktedonosporobacter sp.]|jgi:sarcosine oxidase subunit beta|nr:FAD-binding oxidoreductase [Ktedonosporobacter sp.]